MEVYVTSIITLSFLTTNAIVAIVIIINLFKIQSALQRKIRQISITSLLIISIGFGLQSLYVRYEISVIFRISMKKMSWLVFVFAPINFCGRFLYISEITIYSLKLVKQMESKLIVVPFYFFLKRRGMVLYQRLYYTVFACIMAIVAIIECYLAMNDNLSLETFQIQMLCIHDLVHVFYQIIGVVQLKRVFKNSQVLINVKLNQKIQLLQVLLISCTIAQLLILNVINESYLIAKIYVDNLTIQSVSNAINMYAVPFLPFCTIMVLSVALPLHVSLNALIQQILVTHYGYV